MKLDEELERMIVLHEKVFPAKVTGDLLDYLRHDEFGLALEELSNYICEFGILINEVDYRLICRMARSMGMNEENFSFLRKNLTDK